MWTDCDDLEAKAEYALGDVLDSLRAQTVRAEKAEQERDEALDRVDSAWSRWQETEARAAQPRPVEPTDEMVERARKVEERECGDATAPEILRKMIAAALTEPDRPEGAEDYEVTIIDTLGAGRLTDTEVTELADKIAAARTATHQEDA